MLLLELKSHPASAIKLPPGQAMCTCAQAAQGISGLKQKQGLQAGSFPHAVWSQRALLPGILCWESSSYVLGALNFPAWFSTCNIARGFSIVSC